MLPSKAELPDWSGAENHPPLSKQSCPNLPKHQIEKSSGLGTGERPCVRDRAGAVIAAVTAVASLSWQTFPGEQALWDSQLLLFESWGSWGCIRHVLRWKEEAAWNKPLETYTGIFLILFCCSHWGEEGSLELLLLRLPWITRGSLTVKQHCVDWYLAVQLPILRRSK